MAGVLPAHPALLQLAAHPFKGHRAMVSDSGYVPHFRIVTHTPPLDILRYFYPPEDDLAFVNFLEWVREQTMYRRWYFGHIHLDRIIDPQHVAIYHKIVPVDSR